MASNLVAVHFATGGATVACNKSRFLVGKTSGELSEVDCSRCLMTMLATALGNADRIALRIAEVNGWVEAPKGDKSRG